MFKSVGIRSIAVNFPKKVRTNNYWYKKYPELVAKAEQKSFAKTFGSNRSTSKNKKTDLWSQEMKPYLSDPFRGTVERRVLSPGESSLELQRRAAVDALKAAELSPSDIDLMMVASMFPENIVPGDAAFLAAELDFQGAAWNLDSMCASSMVALQTACSLIRSGEYRNILVVASCAYSRYWDEDDTLSFFVGDGAGAFVVSTLEKEQGVLGTKVINTKESCGIFYTELVNDPQGNPKIRIQANKNAGKHIPDLTLKYFRECCQGALDAANVTLDRINFFIPYTATAWYGSLCARALGIDLERTIDIYPQYGNISAASITAGLYHAAQLQKIQPDDLVLVYNHGFSASAIAVVMRWGDVALGPAPASSTNLIDRPVEAWPEAC